MSNPLAVLSDEAAEGAVNHMAELERENATLRKAVLSLDGDKRNLQHALLRMKQRYDDQLARLEERLGKVEWAASLVEGMNRKIEEIGRVADRSAQYCTVHGLSLPIQEPAKADDLADQVAYHEAHREDER